MKGNSRERRNHVAAMIERSLESHLSVMESYRRKTAYECYPCEQGEKGKYKAFRVRLHAEGNHGKHCQ